MEFVLRTECKLFLFMQRVCLKNKLKTHLEAWILFLFATFARIFLSRTFSAVSIYTSNYFDQLFDLS